MEYIINHTKILLDMFSTPAPIPIRVIWDIEEARKLLKKTTFHERSEMSNEFMLKRFGIENALSTFDDDWRHESLKQTTKFIRTTDEEWKSFADECKAYVRRQLIDLEPGQDMNLRTLVQCFVFRAALRKIYPDLRLTKYHESHILFIVSDINILYDLPDESKSEIETRRSILLGTIDRMFDLGTNGKISPQNNPLNHLFVAFDAMQRVVFRCFLELRYRGGGVRYLTDKAGARL